MCQACFDDEIKSFPTAESFENFDLLLTQKIANDKTLIMLDFVPTRYKDEGYQVYKCDSCDQLWGLYTARVPANGAAFFRVSGKKYYHDTVPFYSRNRSILKFFLYLLLYSLIGYLVWK